MSDFFESISLCFYLTALFLCICHDIWKRSIPIYLLFMLMLFGIPVFINRIFRTAGGFSVWEITELMLSFAPGSILMLLSLVTNEAVGRGDALFFIVSGCYYSLIPLSMVLLLGMLTSGIISIGVIGYGRYRGRCLRGLSIPFLPCLLPALPLLLQGFGGI